MCAYVVTVHRVVGIEDELAVGCIQDVGDVHVDPALTVHRFGPKETDAGQDRMNVELLSESRREAVDRAVIRAEYATLADAAIELRTLRSLRDTEVTIV
ncbi:hypothetical protein ACFV24_12175 [Nocardia fluminea]|uniref:hypothetical protein n=1 Tax=Nocardia fluminea TaxID=134984 RepID=UPI00366EB44F